MRKPAAFSPVPRRRLSEELVEQILASIAAGELRLGAQLPPIIEMARSFGVGASTVREALIRLEAKGVIEIRHGAGVFVLASAG